LSPGEGISATAIDFLALGEERSGFAGESVIMTTRLVYLIKFVADMDGAVAFHRDRLGLQLKFQSPFWSEFATGETTLALHPASDRNPAGSCQPGFRVKDLAALYAGREAAGIAFAAEPTLQHGVLIARFLDMDGAECSISGERS
jgi:catechol 2,3-dioxygenase-like lactoylglutathione lyase family enzyme